MDSVKEAKLNFQSILIVSYGRSGSTLLQGLLNNHEEVVIRGENFNFCFGLFQSYKSLKRTKLKGLVNAPERPFYGAVFLDEDYYLSMVSKTMRKFLLGDEVDNNIIQSYGFKEIRYVKNPQVLREYLSFLKKIFPNPAFIFNTRNKESVIKSREKLQWKTKGVFDSLEETENTFKVYSEQNSDCSFNITYEDVIGKTIKLRELHTFLGLPYSEDRVDRVLSVKHSNVASEVDNSCIQAVKYRKIDRDWKKGSFIGNLIIQAKHFILSFFNH